MAKLESEKKISVEKVVHDSITETVQYLWDEYKIRVDSINVDWLEVESNQNSSMLATKIYIDTVTFTE